jgi:hypothetical protein
MEINTMPKLFIKPTCGLESTIQTTAIDTQKVKIDIESECAAIRKIADELDEVNPFQEMSKRGEGPSILKLGAQLCTHTSCPIPAMMIKAVEVAAGLDLPKETIIEWQDD